jgi:hypothetical protein
MRNQTNTTFAFYASANLEAASQFQNPSKHYVTKDPSAFRASKAVVVARGKRSPKVEATVASPAKVKWSFKTINKVVTIDGVTEARSIVKVNGSNGVRKMFIDRASANAWVVTQK